MKSGTIINYSIKKRVDIEPVHNEKKLKTKKVKSYESKFKISKEGHNCICLSLILIPSFVKIGYLLSRNVLKECKYIL